MPDRSFIDQLSAISLRTDPAWEEARQRLWAMTTDERRTAMYAGRLSLRLCFHWANHAPTEVPVLNGEWWFIAASTSEVADAEESSLVARRESWQ
jgi:hypothetical protein